MGRGLEVDHLDGNHANWEPTNLELACHWCHAARHLEFAMRAGAALVQWDLDQAAISRLTHQSVQVASQKEIYESMVQAGVERREHNYPDGYLANIDEMLRAMINRGNRASATRVLGELHGAGIRIAFPYSYLDDTSDVIPKHFTPESWRAGCAYYRRLVQSVLLDNSRRAKLAERLPGLQQRPPTQRH